jgi:hypothetical protein
MLYAIHMGRTTIDCAIRCYHIITKNMLQLNFNMSKFRYVLRCNGLTGQIAATSAFKTHNQQPNSACDDSCVLDHANSVMLPNFRAQSSSHESSLITQQNRMLNVTADAVVMKNEGSSFFYIIAAAKLLHFVDIGHNICEENSLTGPAEATPPTMSWPQTMPTADNKSVE